MQKVFLSIAIFSLLLHGAEKNANTSKTPADSSCSMSKDTQKRIDQRIKEKRLKSTLLLAEKAYRQCPTQEALVLYTRLLYWNQALAKAYRYSKDLDTHIDENRDLQRKIRQAYAIDRLRRSLDHPSLFQKYYADLDRKDRSLYDVMLFRIDYFLRQKKLLKARKAAEEFYQSYPKSEESIETLARINFWTRHYRESLRLYRKLYKKTARKRDRERIEAIKKILHEAYLKDQNLHLRTLLKQRRFNEAKQVFSSIKDQEGFKSRYRDTYCKVKSIYMLGMGGGFFHQKHQQNEDRSSYVEFTTPFVAHTILYGKIEEVSRYGMHDLKASGELYPLLPEPYWGYLSFSKTLQADFLSDYSLGIHLFYEKFLRYGLGISIDKYSSGLYLTLAPEYAYYLNDYLVWRQVLYYTPRSKSYSILNQLHYETPCHSDYQLNYTYGNSNELSDDQRSFIHQTTHTIELEAEHKMIDQYTLGSKLSWQATQSHSQWSKKKGLEIFLRKYW